MEPDLKFKVLSVLINLNRLILLSEYIFSIELSKEVITAQCD